MERKCFIGISLSLISSQWATLAILFQQGLSSSANCGLWVNFCQLPCFVNKVLLKHTCSFTHFLWLNRVAKAQIGSHDLFKNLQCIRVYRYMCVCIHAYIYVFQKADPKTYLFKNFLSTSKDTLATWCEELTHLKRPWCWERLKAGREGDDRGWDGWMASPTQWTWVWVNSGSWWWTRSPGVLWFMGSQGVGHDWVTELDFFAEDDL